MGKAARLGAEKACESAQSTLKEVKELIGFKRLFQASKYTFIGQGFTPGEALTCFIDSCNGTDPMSQKSSDQ